MKFFTKYKPHLYRQGNLWYIRKWEFAEGWVFLDAQGDHYWWGKSENIRKYCGFKSEEEARAYFPEVKPL